MKCLVAVMDHRTGWGVELPLHQPVLGPQLHNLVSVKDVPRGGGAAILHLQHHRQFKSRSDTWVGEDAPHSLQVGFALHEELDGGPPEPTGLPCRGAQDVLADPGEQVLGQQQQLAVEGGNLGFCQTALYLLRHILMEEPLARVPARTCGGETRVGQKRSRSPSQV